MAPVRMSRRPAAVWALLTSLALLMTYSWYLRGFPLMSTQPPQTEASLTLSAPCLEGVVTVQPGGRLGNLVLEYASAAAVARRHRLQLAVPSDIRKSLSAIFANLSAEPLSGLLQEPACRGQNLPEEKVLGPHWQQPPENASTEEIVQWAQHRHLPVILRRWTVLPDYIASSLETLRQELHFRPELQRAANEKLDKIMAETARKIGCDQTQVCTVGVHVRRTDYWPYMRKRFHLLHQAGADFYQRAATAMLVDLRDQCAAVAFAVTSDDSKWCQHHLLPALSRNASNDSPASAGFLMTSEDPAADLCLLASCRHLVMAYGTFGLTAAILSGGRTLMYDTRAHGAHPDPAAQKMTSLVPHWRLVP